MNDAPVQGLTQRQAAEQLGKSLGWVNRLVRDGVLELLPSGRIDPASIEKGHNAAALPVAEGPARSAKGRTLADVKLQREEWTAKEAALDYHERVGLLVHRSQVEAEQVDIARRVRDEMLGVPATVAPHLVGLTDQRVIESRVRQAVLHALNALSVDDAAGRAAA